MYYYSVEKQFVGKRDCDKCKHTIEVDITLYKDTEYWTCPRCQTEYEWKLY